MNNIRGSIGVAAAAVIALAGCGGSDNDITESGGGDQGDKGYNETVVDARAQTQYLNLATGNTVPEDGDWHVAFNRTKIQLNSGESGNGNVVGAVGDEQAGFYNASGEPDLNKFVGATAAGELDHLKGSFPEPASWKSDGVVYAFGDAEDWSVYGAGGVISEVPDIGYLVRSAEGDSYARMQVVDFDFPTREVDENNKPKGIKSFDLEFEVQAADTNQLLGSTINFTQPVNYDGGDACFDFDADTIVDCTTSDTWDVLIGFSGRDWYLKTNSGPSGPGQGAALGPIDWADLSAYTSATIDSNGVSLARAYSPDATGGLFTDKDWYEYNLQGAHGIWPNFRVYLINSDSEDASAPVYAMQIINYYGADDKSGQPEIRWKKVNLATEEN